MEVGEGVLDRIEQSFELFKNNFIDFFIPIFLFSFFTTTLFSTFSTYNFMSKLPNLISMMNDETGTEGLNTLSGLYTPETMIYIIIGVVGLTLYLILYIPFLLGLIKSIKQSYDGEKPDWKINLKYGFKNLSNSFKTYWYIFAYVVLIPAIIFIVGGILFIYGMQFHQDIPMAIGGGFMTLGGIIFGFFALYRGTKSAFGLYSAVDKQEYTQENFNLSVSATKNKWWRIIGNLILVGIIVSLSVGIINSIIGVFTPSTSPSLSSLLSSDEKNPQEIMESLITTTTNSYSIFTSLINNTIEGILKNLTTIFVIVFTYIFFKRLELENQNTENKNVEAKINQL